MLLSTFLFLFEIFSLSAAAVLHPFWRGRSLEPNAKADCSVVTINNYITVTVTPTLPGTVTVAVPDLSSISSSLASASTVDSLVVVENSQNRPVDAPPNTVVPTFVHSIWAPAIEVTEAAHTGNSAVYIPDVAHQTTIAISTLTESIIISPIESKLALQTATQNTVVNNQTNGWNGTSAQANATHVSSTDTSAVTASPQYEPYAYTEVNVMAKRQTCVLISAMIGEVMATWCNNWDGSSTLSYTSWITTVTGDVHSSDDIPNHDTASPTPPTATTDPDTNPSATVTQTTIQSLPVTTPWSSFCGQLGPFNITFDNLPAQSVSGGQNAGFPPIFDPFDHFYWADGWSYGPPPAEPYAPQDGTMLGIYVPTTAASNPSDSVQPLVPPGGFSAGPRSSTDAYWFSSESAWIGCENNLASPSGTCDFVAEGYRWNEETNTNDFHITQHFTQPLCNSATCPLTQIFFDSTFTSLSAMSFYAKIGGSTHTFYMDDLRLTWWNNTCEAGILRASSRK